MKRLRCRGIAMIEIALLLLFLLVPLMMGCLYYGRMALSGAALDRGTYNAARYLATVPLENLRDSGRRSVVLATAQTMIDEALASSNVAAQNLQVQFLCGRGACGFLTPSSQPATVSVMATMQRDDTMFANDGALELSSYAEVGRGN